MHIIRTRMQAIGGAWFFGLGLWPALLTAQTVTVAGVVQGRDIRQPLPFVNVVLKTDPDTAFVTGTVSDEEGRFKLANVKPGRYQLYCSQVGYHTRRQPLFVGSLSAFLDVAVLEMEPAEQRLGEVTVTGRQDAVGLEKKAFSVQDNLSQAGGSVLQAMQNLPGITVQDGKVQLRGNDKVAVLIDGKQTALTGFGGQTGLANIPASAIDRIEIINNPSARHDANGNAGIINIIYKKNEREGLNGTAGLASGLGAWWEKRENLPGIRPQYRLTPKVNPSLSVNYRHRKVNLFAQSDYLYTETLNKNEFIDRTYADGTVRRQQGKRNRNTAFTTAKAGLDWRPDAASTVTMSALLGTEKIIDRGDQPFFNGDLSERYRLWQFLEDELKTTVTASAAYRRTYKQPGRVLDMSVNYTFHREDEKYFFDNILPDYTGRDAFKLLSDEHVADLTLDYVRPLRYGRLEGGAKFRRRVIPTDMRFFPGLNSPLDAGAGGAATYRETIPAAYGTWVFENRAWEAEAGLRVEYVGLRYEVNPDHNTYRSDGYAYAQPFPNVRLAYKLNDRHKLTAFYNRRVDRPNEVDIRIFPKYDDAEIIKVGNPGLRPQFTSNIELGYKAAWSRGYVYAAAYHRFADGTITRIASTVPGSPLIYAIFQNAGRSRSTGLEAVYTQALSDRVSVNLNLNGYRNQIDAFTVQNLYPVPNTFAAATESLFSANAKLNVTAKLPRRFDVQATALYLAPDLIPQGRIGTRFSVDAGLKKTAGRSEWFLNATDLFNTLRIERQIQGAGFRYTAVDYYETQVVRAGYRYGF